MSNSVSFMIAGSLIDDRYDVGAVSIKRLTETMTLFPQHVLRYLANANTRVMPLARGTMYSDASPALKRLGIDVDAWPAPPAGLFVVEERTVYLRSLSPMTAVHEMGHACDLALGGNVYRSSTDSEVRTIFKAAKAFVTPYAATGADEFVAEGIRAMLGVNDEQSFWPKVSRERLRRLDPQMYAWIKRAFAEMETAVSKNSTESSIQAA